MHDAQHQKTKLVTVSPKPETMINDVSLDKSLNVSDRVDNNGTFRKSVMNQLNNSII